MKRVIFETEHDQFRDSVRRFMQAEVAPHADRWREAQGEGRVQAAGRRGCAQTCSLHARNLRMSTISH